jgi:hypothetical protein
MNIICLTIIFILHNIFNLKCNDLYYSWYVLAFEIQLTRGGVGVGIALTGLTLPHFCAWLKKGPGFPMPYVMLFLVFGEFS